MLCPESQTTVYRTMDWAFCAAQGLVIQRAWERWVFGKPCRQKSITKNYERPSGQIPCFGAICFPVWPGEAQNPFCNNEFISFLVLGWSRETPLRRKPTKHRHERNKHVICYNVELQDRNVWTQGGKSHLGELLKKAGAMHNMTQAWEGAPSSNLL